VRGPGIAHVAAFGLGVLCLPRVKLRKRFAWAVLLGLTAALVILPFMIRNKAICGRFQISSQQGMIGVQIEMDKPGARETQAYDDACKRTAAESLARALSQPVAFAKTIAGNFGYTWNRRLWGLGLPLIAAMTACAALLLYKRHPWGVFLLAAFGSTFVSSLCSRTERFAWPYTWIVISLIIGFILKAAERAPAFARWSDALGQATGLPALPPWAAKLLAAAAACVLVVFAAVLLARNYWLDTRPALVKQPISPAEARQVLQLPDTRPILSAADVRKAIEQETARLPRTTGAPVLVTGEARFVQNWRVPYSYEEAKAEWDSGRGILEMRSKPGFGHVFELAVNSHLKPHSRGEEIVYCLWPFEQPPEGLEDRAVVSVVGSVLPTRFDKEQAIRLRCAAVRRLDK
ncbi:MAG TPA: hypothetical protein P5137_01070, partial [Candidatus Brocadiia bacterium]|nr:hypothetical protein [Candidatus Brocadiia bacterium]